MKEMKYGADLLPSSLIKSIEHLRDSNETIVLMPDTMAVDDLLIPSGPIREGYALVWISGHEGHAVEVALDMAVDLLGLQWMAMRERDFARLLLLQIQCATTVSKLMSLSRIQLQ